MSNESGTNQFGGFGVEAPYGDIKRMTELTEEAPMSGAPFATGAIGAPKSDQKRASKPASRPRAQGKPMANSPLSIPQSIPAPNLVANAWSHIASLPGASDLVKEYASAAASAVSQSGVLQ